MQHFSRRTRTAERQRAGTPAGHRWLGLAALGFLCAALLAPRNLIAGDEPARGVTSVDSATSLIVMQDGRVAVGQVTRQAGGFYLERTHGKIFVPEEQVRCIARNLPDAYRLQREMLVDPSAASLIQLAEWCISYRLYDEASDELKRALRRDPENETARKMLAKLQDTLLLAPKKVATPSAGDLFLAPEVEALGGLSRPTAARFTERIQPLLINKCAAAGCHGGESPQTFRLVHVRSEVRNTRRSTEQNLAAALKQIDFEQPQSSPLLAGLKGGHGGSSKTLFGGPQGIEQAQALKQWVLTVAEERRAEAEKLARQAPLKPGNGSRPKTAPASDTREAIGAIVPVSGTSAPDGTGSGVVPAGGETPYEAGSLPPVPELPRRQSSPRDPFNPDAFNEQFGGGTPPRKLTP